MTLEVSIDTLWILFGTVLIFIMQAGFAMVEAGFTRAKNTGNIVMKNLMDFALGSLMFFLIGYRIMFGSRAVFPSGFSETGTIPWKAHLIFNTMFCATAATIVSGAMAERTKFKAYLIYSVVISAFVYPVSASWVWGGGWLSKLTIGNAAGFIDFAGSSLVHMVGGTAAFIGAAFVGPRIGKYNKEGKPRGIPGHNIAISALGVFLLWFGWFGFNGASVYGLSTERQLADASAVFLNTNISAAASAVTAMFFTWFRYGKPDISMTFNGALAGLVAITSGCGVMDAPAALITGGAAGILVVLGIEFVEKVTKVDDPVGAVGVHGICGLFGTLATGLFAKDTGWITTGNCGQFLVQLIGAAAILGWAGITMTALFFLMKKTIGIRVGGKEELAGLDISEHGLQTAYADFSPMSMSAGFYGIQEEKPTVDINSIQPDMAIPVQIDPAVKEKMNKTSLTKIVILTRQSKFEALKEAMNEIGVTGMTVTQVLGCGMQKGNMEYYRGSLIDTMQMLPKIQVDIVVAKVPAEKVVAAAKKVLYTGHIGDGKIFIYDVKNAIKVRTGEEGYYAMQGVDE